MQALSLLAATAATQPHLTTMQAWPQSITIDEHAPIDHSLGEEGRFALSVMKLNYVNRTTDESPELCAEIDDALEACVAQIDKDINIALRSIRSRSRRAEQQREAHIRLSPQGSS
jgi:ribosomal protein S1